VKVNESPLPVTVSDRSAPSLMEFAARSIWIGKIIVDHLNIGEAASTCDFNQLVLASLAFQVQLNLLWRRQLPSALPCPFGRTMALAETPTRLKRLDDIKRPNRLGLCRLRRSTAHARRSGPQRSRRVTGAAV
jgi:hypothetical protein